MDLKFKHVIALTIFLHVIAGFAFLDAHIIHTYIKGEFWQCYTALMSGIPLTLLIVWTINKIIKYKIL